MTEITPAHLKAIKGAMDNMETTKFSREFGVNRSTMVRLLAGASVNKTTKAKIAENAERLGWKITKNGLHHPKYFLPQEKEDKKTG